MCVCVCISGSVVSKRVLSSTLYLPPFLLIFSLSPALLLGCCTDKLCLFCAELCFVLWGRESEGANERGKGSSASFAFHVSAEEISKEMSAAVETEMTQ